MEMCAFHVSFCESEKTGREGGAIGLDNSVFSVVQSRCP